MSSEPTRRSAPLPARHRHPVTCLLTGIVLSSYLTLNFWNAEGDHGFPFVWMTRETASDAALASHNFLVKLIGEQPRTEKKTESKVTWERCRSALPLEFFRGDLSRVREFSIPLFLVASVLGTVLIYFPYRWFDWFFGRRAQPFYRFGLGRLLIGVSAAAVFFALTNESRTLMLAKGIVILAVPATWLGISTWVVQRERGIARMLVRRRREEERAREERAVHEIELTDLGPSQP